MIQPLTYLYHIRTTTIGCVLVFFFAVVPAMGQTGTIKSHQKISDTDGNFTGVLDDVDRFASSVTSLGDLDGDGVVDLAVTEPEDDDGGSRRGAVWILFMNSNGTVKSHQKISDTQGSFTGVLDDDDLFGTSAAGLGDLDGDSVEDLAVGAPTDDDGGAEKGAVWILFLNTNGTVKSHQKISDTDGSFTGALTSNDNFANSMVSVGDLDGDSITDLAVGATDQDDGGSNRGAVWMLFLNTNGTVKSHQKISDTDGSFTGTLDDGDAFGGSVAAMGDLDGDGVEDLAVGTCCDDDGGTDRGAVWMLFLNTNGTVKSHQKISDTDGNFTGILADGVFWGGSSATSAGDLDGDGVTDLVVGAQRDDDGSTDRGAVWALLMNTDGTVKSDQKISDTAGNFTGVLDDSDEFGRSVTSVGDLDGDGVSDLVVGANKDDDGGTDRGAAWVLFLQRAGFTEVGNVAGMASTNGSKGVGWGDYDGDGDLDLFVSTDFGDDLLYKNNGDGTFTDVASSAGMASSPNSFGMAWSDYDNDGDLDLYVTKSSADHLLYRNNGDGTFTDVASSAGVNSNGGQSTGVSWMDYNLDGAVDLYVVNFSGANWLYKNNGDNTFTDVASSAGVATASNDQIGIWADYDLDGDPDLYLDRNGGNLLYQNDGDGTFTDVATTLGVNDGGQGRGASWVDYDNDGDPDLFLAIRDPSTNVLFQNDGDGTFTDVTTAASVGNTDFASGSAWADYDLDGDLDLHVPNFNSSDLLYSNDGDGTFTEMANSAGVDDGGGGIASSWGDYDGDGDLDLYLARNNGEANRFYRNNNSNSNRWLHIELTSQGQNRSSIGTKVTAVTGSTRQRRDVDGGSGYWSQPSLALEFGFGGTTTVDSLIVEWATGQVTIQTNVGTNQVLALTETTLPTFDIPSTGISHTADGGISWVDYDGDSDLDLFLSDGGSANKLYQNDGSGNFTDVAGNAGVNISADAGGHAAWGDYDNDGDLDGYLSFSGSNRLYQNNGSGGFTDVGASAGVNDSYFTWSGVWSDLDNDGDLDLFVPSSGGSDPDLLYRNDGGSVFTEIASSAGLGDTGNEFPATAADFDGDGDLDIYLPRDNQANKMYRNNGDLTFTDVAGNAGVNLDNGSRGRGGIWGDYDSDGDLDLYLSNWKTSGTLPLANRLYQNDGSGQFTEVSEALGVDETTFDTNDAAWVDFDNDNDLDLFLLNNLNLSSRLFINQGDGTFSKDVGKAVGVVADGQAARSAWADYDGDGDLDIAITRCCGNSTFIYRNLGNANRWLQVNTVGTASNRSGIGAEVTAVTGSTRQLRLVESTAGSGRQESLEVEFGFGSTTTVDSLIVDWPSGLQSVQTNVSNNQALTITEPTPTFTNVAASAGVNDVEGDVGTSWADYDGDGDLDLYVAASASGANDKLYRNNGSGVFSDVAASAGISAGSNNQGGIWADYDADGDLDFYLADNGGVNELYQNDGDGTFTEVAASAGVNATGAGNGISWADYDNDGDVDFYLAQNGIANKLYQNEGNATFTDVTSSAGVGDTGFGRGIAWADYDGDGYLDLYLGNWAGANLLYKNDGDGTFTEVAASLGVNDGNSSPGVSWGDYDNDGDPDLYVSNWDVANRLYSNDGDGTFTEVGSAAGVNDALKGQYVGWADYDNDGNLDLYVTNSAQPNRLYHNNGDGTFSNVAGTAGVVASGGAAGIGAWGDYDGDGDLDLYITSSESENVLYRNNGNANQWLQVDLTGALKNTVAIGSKVTAVTGSTRQQRDVDGGSGWLSQPSQAVEFGFGSTTTVDSLIVDWATGQQTVQTNVSTNQKLALTEPTPTFTEVGASAGVSDDTGGGRGVAWADYDGDGDLDFYLANQATGDADKLYRNNGDGTFTDVRTSAGVIDAGNEQGGSWADYDGDGDLDLYIVTTNPLVNQLYRNNGDGTFTEVGASAGVNDTGAGRSAGWADYDKDGDVDFYLTDASAANKLFQNDGDGTFTEVGVSAGVNDAVDSRSIGWADYDDDGHIDLYVGNGDNNRLYKNDGDGTFTDVALSLGVNDPSLAQGVVWGDYDNDADMDLFVANHGVADRLYRNDGGTFTAVGAAAGVNEALKGQFAGWADYDNDGNLDLYVLNNGQPNRLYRNKGDGTFTNVAGAAGVVAGGLGGASGAWADYDGDGDMDLYVAADLKTNFLYRNNGNSNRWLQVDLSGTQKNIVAIGAKVTAVTGSNRQAWQVDGGGGFLSQPSLTVEFGFGSTTTVDSLIVAWPKGGTQVLTNVSTNQTLTVTQVTLNTATPTANDVNVVKSANVTATFSENMQVGNAASLVIHGVQTGELAGTYGGGGTTTLSFDPNNDFKPGEKVQVSFTGGNSTSLGVRTKPHVFEFRVAAGVGTAVFSGGETTSFGLGNDDTREIALGDVDGDGDLDIAIANYNQQNGVYLNDGSKVFASNNNFGTGTDASHALALGDVDGDGDLDAVVGNFGQQDVAYLNNGSGSFSGGNNFGTGSENTHGLALGDVDGDGDLDVALGVDAIGGSGQSEVRLNDGSGNFTSGTRNIGTGTDNTKMVAFGDVDGDGDLDIAMGHNGHQNRVDFNNGEGYFVAGFENFDVFNRATYAVPLADVDGDGDLDVASGNASLQQNVILLNDGTGKLTAGMNNFGSTDRTLSTAFGDIDGDGDVDMALGNYNHQSVAYLNDGSGNFTAGTKNFGSGDLTWSVALGDLDGDGDLDIASGNEGQLNVVYFNQLPDPTPIMPTANTRNAAKNTNISATFSQNMKVGHAASIVVHGAQTGELGGTYGGGGTTTLSFDPASDLKSGEDVQVVFTGANSTVLGGRAEPYVFQFKAAAGTGPADFSTVSKNLGPGNDNTNQVDLGDIDGDGDVDVAVANASPTLQNVAYLNNGSGDFTSTSINYGTGSDASLSQVLGDVDGDGDLDVAVGNWSAQNTVHLNNGSGSFTGGNRNFGTGSDLSLGLALGDMDGDGDADLLLANTGPNQNAICLNDGSGNFPSSSNFGGSENTDRITVGDMDNDGDLDVVVGNTNTHQNFVHLNDGNAIFTSLAGFAASGDDTREIQLADVDADGDLDAVTGNNGQQNTVYLNSGSGTFSGNTDFGLSNDNTYAIQVGDVDGDGDLDIAVGNYIGFQDAVFLNNGSGTFSTSSNYGSANDDTHDLGLGDLDGDGDLDLVAGNINSQQNLVYLNESSFINETTAAAGLSGAVSVVPGGEVQVFSIGLTGDGLATVNSIALTLADLAATTGIAQSDFSELRLYHSTDATLDGSDTQIGTVAQGSINIGSATTIAAGTPDTPPNGVERFYLVAAVIPTVAVPGHAFTVGFAANGLSTNLGGRGTAVVGSDANKVEVQNQAPTAHAQSVTTDEDVAKDIILTGSDPNGDSLTFAIAAQPTNGSVSVADSTATYTPTANFNGSDSFTFTVNDGQATSVADTVSVTVNAINDAPVLSSIAAQNIAEGQSLSLTLTATDVDGDVVTYSAENLPTGASLSGAVFIWTPGFDQAGSYTSTLKASDGKGGEGSQTLTIQVANAVPPAVVPSPASWDFGDVANKSVNDRVFQLQNPANAPVTVDNVQINSAEFTLVSPSFPQTITGGGSLAVTVRFAPPADSTTLQQGSATVTSGTDVVTVSLSGRNAFIGFEVSPTSLDFGKVRIGSIGTLNFTVANPGNLRLDISVGGGDVSNSLFSITPTVFQVEGGDSQVLTVTFSPTLMGTQSGSITLGGNASAIKVLTVQGEGSAPVLSLSATALDLGDVRVGDVATLNLIVSNTGNDSLQVTNVISENPLFSVDSTAFEVLANNSFALAVLFAPDGIGEEDGILTLTTNIGTVTLELMGTGFDSDWTVSPSPLDFGGVRLGTSASLQVSIVNRGETPVGIDSFMVVEGEGVVQIVDLDLPPAIAGGDSIDVATVEFTPIDLEELSDVILHVKEGGKDRIVQVRGRGLAPPMVVVEKDSLDFLSMEIGEAIVAALEIRNAGGDTLHVEDITASLGVFAATETTFDLAPGLARTIEVTYIPVEEGEVEGRLDIVSDDPQSPHAVHLRGNLRRSPILRLVSPRDLLRFAIVPLGESELQTVRLRNRGQGLLKVVLKSEQAEFIPQEQDTIRIEARQSREVLVRFQPLQGGSRQGILIIESNDERVPQTTLVMQGIGGELHFEPPSVQFGEVVINENAAAQVTAINYTSEEVTLELEVRGFGFGLDKETVRIDVGERVPLQVTFRPPLTGQFDGLIRVAGRDQEVELSGTGVEGPDIEIAQATGRDFGTVEVGRASEGAFTVSNRGQGVLRIFDLTSNRLEYRVVQVDSLPLAIQPGQNRRIDVEFRPLGAGLTEGVLTLVSNDPQQREIILALEGRGVAPPALQLPEIFVVDDDVDFGMLIDDKAPVQSLLIQNRGGGVLRVNRIEAGAQVAAVPESLIVGPGDTRRVSMHLSALPQQEQSGLIRILSNDRLHPELKRRWIYERPTPVVSVLTEELRFGVGEGSQRSALLAVFNRGNSPLVVDLIDDAGELSFARERLVVQIDEIERTQVFYGGGKSSGEIVLVTNDPLNREVLVPWQAEENVLQLLVAEPQDGALGVDTELELRLLFDQPIRRLGRPVEGPGFIAIEVRIFPEPLNRWRRQMRVEGGEVRIPLELEADRTYRLVVVNATSQNGAEMDKPFEMSLSTGVEAVAAGSFSGQIAYEDGSTPAGTVYLANEARQLVGLIDVDQEGAYAFEQVAIGHYQIFFQEEGTDLSFARQEPVEVSEDERVVGVDLTIPAQQEILGIVPIEEPVEIETTPTLLADSTFIVPIRTDPVEDLIGFVVRLAFNPEAVALIDAAPESPEEGNALQVDGGFGFFLTRVVDEGTMEYGGAVLGPDEATAPDAGGLLVYLTFRALRSDAEVEVVHILRRTLRGSDLIGGGVIRPPLCAGDFDGDGQVAFSDFFLFADNFGLSVPPGNPVADLDGDGEISFGDFFIFADSFGSVCHAAKAVPLERAANSLELEMQRRANRVAVEVQLEQTQAHLGYGFLLHYDPLRLRYRGVEAIAGNELVLANEQAPGELLIGRSWPGTADRAPLQMAFDVLAEGGRLEIDQAILRDLAGRIRPLPASYKELLVLPGRYALEPNYPNPFNPETTIGYQLPEEAEVFLAIYDILGQQVRNIVHQVQPGGIYQVRWNGRDDNGREVASGVYFYQLRANNFKSVHKLVYLK